MTESHDANANGRPAAEVTPGSEAAPLAYAEVTPAAAAPMRVEVPANVPEDLRVEWSWTDLGILLVVGIGCTLIATQVTATLVLGYTGLRPQELNSNPSAVSVFTALSQVVLSLLVLAYLMVQVRLRVGAPFWTALGYRPFVLPQRSPWASYSTVFFGGMALAIVVAMVGALVRTQKELPIQKHFQTVEGMALLGTLAVLIAPLFEETLFRGYLYPVVARSFGVRAGVLGTGVLFGLVHAMQLWGGWGEITLLILVGIVFTYARAATGSVLASFLLHLGYNSLLVLAQFAATGGFRHMPGNP